VQNDVAINMHLMYQWCIKPDCKKCIDVFLM